MNEQERLVYNSLSVTEYTKGTDFTPRLEGLVPRDDIGKILQKLEAEGLTELCYGWGWRAVESDASRVDPAMAQQIEMWREKVASGATMLDFKRWFINEIVKYEKKENPE